MILAVNPIDDDEAEEKKYGGCDEIGHGGNVKSKK
jgi:hypothetical protein